MYLAGRWTSGTDRLEVRSPYDGSVIDTVPRATAADVDTALESAVRGAAVMKDVPAHRRARILRDAAERVEARSDEFAGTITQEEGKSIHEARTEVARTAETPLSAFLLTEVLLESGLPEEAIQCVTGGGREVGALEMTELETVVFH